ncbi:hypothetical protein NECAME_13723 [Necator americanus]|uniref:SCP domain-containing protein n=1 Tax=Necator americanus TaxID=51031 RepID=W2STH0_NECAM|nr:hypothetical protein NECAME_13723 [Necator americanus]ETN72773.1 hypothetical protein NECAME_13723 [Necator americanus]
MFLVLLSITLVVSYGDVNNTEPYIILRNKDKCRMEAEFRKIMDKQHNLLRQQVAFGHTYLGKNFTSQEMCGLVYDCGIEEKARKELYYPGSISDRYDVMYFESNYNRRDLCLSSCRSRRLPSNFRFLALRSALSQSNAHAQRRDF